MSPSDAVATKVWSTSGAAGNPQELNRYSYALNNPMRYTDPSGHCVPGPLLVWCGIAAGAFVTEVVIPAVIGAAVIAGAAVVGQQLGESQRANAETQPETSGEALGGTTKAPEWWEGASGSKYTI
jgi:hypothetical protein